MLLKKEGKGKEVKEENKKTKCSSGCPHCRAAGLDWGDGGIDVDV